MLATQDHPICGCDRAVGLRLAGLFAVLVLWPAGALADVLFEGLDERQEINVRAFVQLADAPCEVEKWQLARLRSRAPGQIRESLEALGHYQARVRADDPASNKKCWQMTYRVDPGPRVTFDRVSILIEGEGKDDPAFIELLGRSQLQTGDALDHGVYEKFKRSLINTATERGYFEAGLSRHEVVVDSQGAHARVDILFKSGPRYRFGEVRYNAAFLATDLLDKYNDIEPGSPYDASQLTSTHRGLLDTGYFRFVNVNADPARAVDRTIAVDIDLAPAKKRIYSGGLGFATDSGPRFRLNYRNRLINRRGHTLNGELLLSTVQSLVGVEYRIPEGDDRRNLLLFRTGVEQEDTDTSETQAVELSVRRVRAINKDWLQTFFVDARIENFKIGNQDADSRLIVPGISYWNLMSGSDTGQRLGHSWFFELRGTSEIIGSDTRYLQVIAQARRITSLGERSRLLTRIGFGATAKKRFNELPPSTRFFAGGDRSVRGYSFESLGPTNADGEVIGGSNLITANVEIDWAINERWGLAVFADTGAAFNSERPDFSSAVGIGLRRQSPLGPIRIDFAHPFDLDRTVRLHISFGPDL